MALMAARRGWLGAGMALLAAGCVLPGERTWAQAPIGSVSTVDATVTGASSVTDDRAQLGTNGTVVAKDHAAYIQLLRGGSVKVCATSVLHLTAGTPTALATPDAAASAGAGATPGSATAGSPATSTATTPPLSSVIAAWQANIPPPLMVSLDRGAMELKTGTVAGDIVMTPDLRFTFSGDGQLDVRIRVGRNGDTCVENRVIGLSGHPGLQVGSLFGSETYNILAGQHVLLEGGSLREVVDNESSPCGCPEEVKPSVAVAEIPAKKVVKITSAQAEALHPFPADVSQGLAPPPPVPQAPPQVTHTQVATTMVYNGSTDPKAKKDEAAKSAPEEKKGFFRSIGRFFKKVF